MVHGCFTRMFNSLRINLQLFSVISAISVLHNFETRMETKNMAFM